MIAEENYLNQHYILPKTYKSSQLKLVFIYVFLALIFLIALVMDAHFIRHTSHPMAADIFIYLLTPAVPLACFVYYSLYASHEGITLGRHGVTILRRNNNIEIPSQNILGYDLSYVSISRGGYYRMSLIYTSASEKAAARIAIDMSTDWYEDEKFLGWLGSMKNFGKSNVEDAVSFYKNKSKSQPMNLIIAFGIIIYLIYLFSPSK